MERCFYEGNRAAVNNEAMRYSGWMDARTDLINKNVNSLKNTNLPKAKTNILAGHWLKHSAETPIQYVDISKFYDNNFVNDARKTFLKPDQYGLNTRIEGLYKWNSEERGIFFPIRKDEFGNVIPIKSSTKLEEQILEDLKNCKEGKI